MMDKIDKIYQARFDPATIAEKNELWKTFVEHFLQRYVPADAVVADIGAGYCEFINAVRCRKKYVVDLNPDVKSYANPDVEVLMCDARDISALPDETLDVAFVSNFFEHLASKEVLFEVLAEIRRVLKRGGKILIIQANIKYAYREYWDFIDHHLPLTENSLEEALIATGYEVAECIPRFLPFSVKFSPSRSTKLLRLYLKMPLAWKLFGKVTFMVGVKS
jgi:ubiquinone/menaquinone biosynthesis C-methylase UbiE